MAGILFSGLQDGGMGRTESTPKPQSEKEMTRANRIISTHVRDFRAHEIGGRITRAIGDKITLENKILKETPDSWSDIKKKEARMAALKSSHLKSLK